MTQRYRLVGRGADIDRSQGVAFAFDGTSYRGYEGDTLASALLANGVHLMGRSFKYHRPRGVISAGPEEPNALVQLGPDAARTDPNSRATQVELFDGLVARSQNRWPSLRFDFQAVNDLFAPLIPAGFYYKTFMWPRSPKAWMVYERFIRKAAGLGVSPRQPDPDRYDHVNAHCDVLVVGGGLAGLGAALAAARAGARVILAEDQPRFGGWLRSEPTASIGDTGALDWVEATVAELASMPDVRVLPRTTAFGYYGHNWLGLLERTSDHIAPHAVPAGTPRQRLWKVRAKQVVLATGSIERSLVFAENDRPGILLAGAARAYLHRWGVKVGEKVVVATGDDSAYATALDLAAAGVAVPAIVDTRPDPDGPLVRAARAAGLPVYAGHAVVGTSGRLRVNEVRLMPLAADGQSVRRGAETTISCDAVAMSGGWNPVLNLQSQSRGRLRWDEARSTFMPGQSFQAERSAGGCAGTLRFAEALQEGLVAGAAAASAAGLSPVPLAVPPVATAQEEPAAADDRPLWSIPSDRPANAVRAFVDFQNDVTAKDIRLALREGMVSVEHVKRYTTTGMATDQGKTGNVNALGIVAQTMGKTIPEIGVTTFRPPYTPVTFGAIAGRGVKALYAPIRRTPMHSWAEKHGAVFENVGGGWKRAWYFPKPGEDMHAAVNREVKAARTSVGVMDATTLGKIDVRGPDAAEFLNRVYTNAWAKLAIGGCRYGLMLGEDGMVKDDGVTTRLADDHFHMTTTTGGAATILAWLEEWLQTEWPDLKVFLTSATEQWAVATISGPKCRELLSRLTDLDLSNEAFPHLTMREGTVAGLAARVFRISFTGELSYEINVPAAYGLALIEAIETAGQGLDLVPYGTEAMHVLRAEKGFIIVGQETDGTTTPGDLGMDWIVGKKKPDFIGKRSLDRADTARSDRKQLVGLLTDDPKLVLEEGAHIIDTANPGAPPVPMLGHVTSSYWSPNLDRSIALAMVKGGSGRLDGTVHIAMPDRTIVAKVVKPVFVDPEGGRLHA
ncbi:sarcosine oxidase subunit alpha family protein [Mycobacterium sp. KBS0706]|uniref:sarcosine oxidase subunit alpha family protein n=1 Tax=Mycobacterium sp. KBS0706 TaxID=2578109 RepID=UPI00110FC5D6|nr:sarcosine oxidase subunit alpha family protein [Mycobacterium sp. KBS0706]TSD86857.1 sarcosine oxidase subunit alpha family protein [Mycobacterium sp. KBS0706]